MRFYLDEQIGRAVANGLTRRGHDVLMAVDASMTGKDDDSEQGRVMVTFDRPFAGRVMSRQDHAGLVCLSESLRHDVGRTIGALVDFAERHAPEQIQGQVFWLKT